MLDRDDALTPYIFEAAGYEGQIITSLVTLRNDPNANRDVIFSQILAGPLPQLRRLLREHFGDEPGLARKLDAIQDAIMTRQALDDIWRTFLALEEPPGGTFGTAFI